METNALELESNFLPQGYKVPDKSRQFLKLKQGENKIRFLSTPLLGSVIFDEEKKPHRKDFRLGEFTPDELADIKPKIDAETGSPETPKHFWIALVWDYSENAPKILEITQITILKVLFMLTQDEDWGDLRNFDIVINKSGSSKLDTEYAVVQKPHKELSKEIQNVVEELESKQLLNLEAIWKGEYPFLNYNY